MDAFDAIDLLGGDRDDGLHRLGRRLSGRIELWRRSKLVTCGHAPMWFGQLNRVKLYCPKCLESVGVKSWYQITRCSLCFVATPSTKKPFTFALGRKYTVTFTVCDECEASQISTYDIETEIRK